MADILIVEDKESLRTMLRKTLESRGYAVDEAADAYEARRRLSAFRYLVVLTDLRLPAGSGFDVLQAAREADPETPVVVMTAFGTVEEAVRAMKEGAADFLTKPVDTDHLLLLLDRAIDKRRMVTELVILKEEYQRRFGLPRVLGEDPALKEAMLALQRAAGTDATVLLLGESGTGKELMSRALHQLSARAKGPFVAINCAAIPENLLENELFGHEKGAFTGATGRKVGKAELAHKGTLFLDEIGDLPLPLQGKILRLVQERQFERVGGLQTLSVDVRVVAATNRDLRELVAEKLFREDLYFRLSVMPIEIPPLRRRRRDVPLLAEAFLQRLAREMGRKDLRLSDEAKRALVEHSWPGNVRELQNCLERAAILSDGPVIEPVGPAARPADARRPRPRRRPGPDRAARRGGEEGLRARRGGGDRARGARGGGRPRRRRREPRGQRLDAEPPPAPGRGEAGRGAVRALGRRMISAPGGWPVHLALCVLLLPRAVLLGEALFERDLHLDWYPRVRVLVATVRSGFLPLWDLSIGFGQPLLGDPSAQVLYPTTWLGAPRPALDALHRLCRPAPHAIAVGMTLLARAAGLRQGEAVRPARPGCWVGRWSPSSTSGTTSRARPGCPGSSLPCTAPPVGRGCGPSCGSEPASACRCSQDRGTWCC